MADDNRILDTSLTIQSFIDTDTYEPIIEIKVTGDPRFIEMYGMIEYARAYVDSIRMEEGNYTSE